MTKQSSGTGKCSAYWIGAYYPVAFASCGWIDPPQGLVINTAPGLIWLPILGLLDPSQFYQSLYKDLIPNPHKVTSMSWTPCTVHPSIDKDFKTMYAKSSNSAGFRIAGYDSLIVLSPIFGLRHTFKGAVTSQMSIHRSP